MSTAFPESEAVSDPVQVMLFVASAVALCAVMMGTACCVAAPCRRAAAPPAPPPAPPPARAAAGQLLYVVVDQPGAGEYALGLLRPRADKKMCSPLEAWEAASLSSRPTASPTCT